MKPINGYVQIVVVESYLTDVFKFYIFFLAVEGHSVYIRNLPLNVTVSQLEAEFVKFGAIKQNGVQVRSNKVNITTFFFCTVLFA